MAETEVVSPPPVPLEEPVGKDVPEKREEKPERPRRELEDVPVMTVEEAHKALNALPKAEAQPDNDEHELKVAAINEDIKKIKDQIEVLRTKIDGANEARRGQGDEMGEARAVMRALKEERDEIKGQLDAMQADSARAKAALDGHDKSRRALQSSLKYKTVAEIETAIRQMEARQQTSSMSLAEEKKLIKEMEQLKQSKKTAAQYVSHEEAVGKAKDGYGAARKTESEKKAELKVIHEKLKVAFTVLEEMGKAREEEGGGVNALFEEKKALHEEINVKIEEIKELRNAHRARLDQWYNSKRERAKLMRALKTAEFMERQALRTARNKAFEDEEAKKIPYESEMVLCDTLVSYLETTFMKETPKTAATAARTEAASTEEFGGMKMMKRQNEEFIVGGKKKGGGRRKSGGKNAPGGRSTIVHAIDTMESFSMLSIAPPPNKAAVPDAIKALKDKKAWFSKQPRQPMTAGKPVQAAEKTKKPPKVKAPDINDEEFPGLPGMAKPKVQEASEDSDAEKVNGAGEDGEDGGGEGEAAESEKVVPTAASIVANGVNGVAKPEAEAPAVTAATSSDEPADAAAEDAPEADAYEGGAEVVEAAAAATAASDDDADAADTNKAEAEQKTDSSPAVVEAAVDCAKPEAADAAEKEGDEEGGEGEDKKEVVEEIKAGAEEAKDGGQEG